MKSKKQFLAVLMALVIFNSCEKDSSGNDDLTDSKNYYVISVNQKQKITTTDAEDSESHIESTVRFLIRGTLEAQTPEGAWEINCQLFSYMDMQENTNDNRIVGYISGQIYWNPFTIELVKNDIGIADPEDISFISYYSSNTEGLTMPFYYITPGKYDYITYGDDGSEWPYAGISPFLTGWPTKYYIDLGGKNGIDNCNQVKISFDMIDQNGIIVDDVYVEGSLLKFNTKNERDEWITVNPFPGYLTTPELIIN